MNKVWFFSFLLFFASSGCSTLKSAFGVGNETEKTKPIENPFGDFYSSAPDQGKGYVLRTKKGDRAVEVEMPSSDQGLTNFIIPMSPRFKNDHSERADDHDYTQTQTRPSLSDREIASTFPRYAIEEQGKQREIEEGLGLAQVEGETPESDSSYLAAIDKIKSLFKTQRFEAGLLELDKVLPLYPTNPKLYEMKGSLLSHMGYEDLAVKAWKESVKLNPRNDSLKKFLDQRTRAPSNAKGPSSMGGMR